MAVGTVRVAAADCTGVMRRIIAGAVVGSWEAWPNPFRPGCTWRRFVPNRSSWASRSARLDAEIPTTDTIAAIPMAMPSAVRMARERLVRSPRLPTPRRSRRRTMPPGVVLDQPVAHLDAPRQGVGDGAVVRDDDERGTAGVELAEHAEHLGAGP